MFFKLSSNKDFMSCSQCTLQFFYHHLQFCLYCSNTQTLAGANDLSNSDVLIYMWGKGTVLAPNSFNSEAILYLLVLVQLKLDRETTQKGCMTPSPKEGSRSCYDPWRTYISCCDYFLCIVQDCSEIFVHSSRNRLRDQSEWCTLKWNVGTQFFTCLGKKKVVFWKLYWRTERSSCNWFEC